ncbi:MAG TPA: AAA domain-containing protein, partial [Candidatus Baltobacteraceae bacterium]|nr:AAA domain-containing protein [Candidatus Baltobacteraceae bacterium]
QKAALVRLAQSFLHGTLPPATLDLLLSRDPRLCLRGPVQPHPLTVDGVSAAAQALDGSYLFIQGPPGSGKTTIGSAVICDLLESGKRVGVLSNSHKAIHNLLHKVEACAIERGKRFKGRYKYTKGNGDSQYESHVLDPMIAVSPKNEDFENPDVDLIAGTAFLFSREPLAGSLDYLFIDEAGQISLADAVAVSSAARNIVLLGDPLQLAQVSQGTHPLHAGDSVLQHLLNAAPTVPETRGIFLEISYRMHPAICEFISTSVYAGRLHSAPSTHRQAVAGQGLSGSGLRFIPVPHIGNSRESVEEAQRLAHECALLLQSTLTDDRGLTRDVRERDIIVVTPYNAQRRLIIKVLRQAGLDVRVGTVDKFQGQEAFVVFYSMATSSGDDMPRDVKFLFEPNRFNVAISRARALSVLLCSPSLLDVSCSTTQTMASVNLLCAFAEQAEPVHGMPHIAGTSSLRMPPQAPGARIEYPVI